MQKFILGAIACATIFTACNKDDNNKDTSPSEMTKISLGTVMLDQDQTATLWADDSLTTGYHKLYLSIEDASGAAISDATVSFLPLMDMGMMLHSSPVESPVYNASTKLYEGAAVFTMSSGSHAWTINATINGTEKSFPVHIPEAVTKITGTYNGKDNNKYVVTLIPPAKWEVGMNDLEILVNKGAEDMMSFPPVEGLEISFEPEMPSMGHGSPNNENPVSEGKGHYKGKVNYTMTGDWTLHFELKENGIVLVEDATIDILF